MSRQKYSVAFLQGIPERILRGETLSSIADTVGGSRGSLKVICSRNGISLPRNNRHRDGRTRMLLRISAEAERRVRVVAAARGSTSIALMEVLIETIANENLFNAILDDEE